MSEIIQDEGAKTIGVYAASNRRIFTLKVGGMFVRKWILPCRRCVEKNSKLCSISGCRRQVDENCPLLGYHAAFSGNPLSTFRHNLSVPSSRVKNPLYPWRWDQQLVPNWR